MFGTPEQKERWLFPLVAGEIRSFFSMTEPEVPGSDPTTLRTRAVRDGDEWVIDGHKWFSSGADGAAFGIVMAVTDPDAPAHSRASQIVVPADTPGVDVVRPVPVMGHVGSGWSTHCEVWYRDVRVPVENVLGEPGAGFRIAQKRLGPGRIHHVMRWLGQMQRAFELMCSYSLEREAFGSRLADKQTVQNWIADSAAGIHACRLMTLDAARKIDEGDEARVEVSRDQVLRRAGAARRDRPRNPGARRAGLDGRDAAGRHVRDGARRADLRRARTRSTAWSSRAASSRSSRTGACGGSSEPRRHARFAADRRPRRIELRARRAAGARAGPGRGARPRPLDVGRPVPARPHERGALVREARGGRRGDDGAGGRRGGREQRRSVRARRPRRRPARLAGLRGRARRLAPQGAARARPADAGAARDRRDGVHRVLRPARRLRAEARRHGGRLGRGRRRRADRRPDREAGRAAAPSGSPAGPTRPPTASSTATTSRSTTRTTTCARRSRRRARTASTCTSTTSAARSRPPCTGG